MGLLPAFGALASTAPVHAAAQTASNLEQQQ
jgi:hypothetical protein